MLGFIKKLFAGGPAVDYKELLKDGALIVDVRTPGEFNTGHIKGALNIPLDVIKSRIDELKRKNKTIITCCRSGNRSSMAKGILHAAGIDCYNGGAWNTLDQKIR